LFYLRNSSRVKKCTKEKSENIKSLELVANSLKIKGPVFDAQITPATLNPLMPESIKFGKNE